MSNAQSSSMDPSSVAARSVLSGSVAAGVASTASALHASCSLPPRDEAGEEAQFRSFVDRPCGARRLPSRETAPGTSRAGQNWCGFEKIGFSDACRSARMSPEAPSGDAPNGERTRRTEVRRMESGRAKRSETRRMEIALICFNVRYAMRYACLTCVARYTWFSAGEIGSLISHVAQERNVFHM